MFSFQEQGQLFRKSRHVLSDLTGLQPTPLPRAAAGLPPHSTRGSVPRHGGWFIEDNTFEGWQLLQVCWAKLPSPRGSLALHWSHGALPAHAEGAQTMCQQPHWAPATSSHPPPSTTSHPGWACRTACQVKTGCFGCF